MQNGEKRKADVRDDRDAPKRQKVRHPLKHESTILMLIVSRSNGGHHERTKATVLSPKPSFQAIVESGPPAIKAKKANASASFVTSLQSMRICFTQTLRMRAPRNQPAKTSQMAR